MGARIRAHDWATTPLGPLDAWSPGLKTAVGLMLASGFATTIAWGREALLLYNDAFSAILGPRHPGALGQSSYALFPAISASFAPPLARVWRGETVTLEDQPYPVERGAAVGDAVEDGWFTLTYTPLRDEAGAVAGVYTTLIETTRRVRAEAALRASEERQAFLLRLSDALRPLADPVAIQDAATRILGAHLDVDRAYYVEIDDARGVAVVARDYVRGAAPSLVGEHPLAPFGSMLAVIRAGRPYVAADAEADPALAADLADYRARALRAFVSVPLIKDGALVAAMCVTCGTPRRWAAGEVALVEETAERTWAALERARAEAASRASEALFRSFAESSADTLWIVDAATRRLEYLSPAFKRMWGEERDAVLHDLRRWAEVVHPDDRAEAGDALPRVLAGETVLREYRIVRPSDRATRWIRDTGFPIRDATGRVARAAGVAQDITDHKEAEAALRASEARFRAVANLVPDLLWESDPDGVTGWYNRRWVEYTGQTLAGATGWGWAEAIHPDDRAASVQRYRAAVAAGAPLRQEHRIRRHDGAYRWFVVTTIAVTDEGGAVVKMYGAATDIQEQRAAREGLERRVAERTAELAAAVEGLRASEGRLRLLVEQMPAALWTTDMDLRVTTLTGAAVPALPATLRAADGRVVADLFAAGDADGLPVGAHRRALAGASVGFEVEAEGRTYAAHVEPLRDADGRIVGAIGVAHDVTDRALLRLQDEFLALASHELRTPLTPTLGYLDMLPRALAAGNPERVARYAALAREQVDRLNGLVGDLLEVGRLRGGKLDLDMQTVDLGAVVGRAIEAARVEAGAQGQAITLDVDAPAAAPLLVRGDAGRLEQVALNLLTNAVKYAPRSPTIVVRLRRDADAGMGVGEATLEVQDDGPGIPAADLPHLFSRFYQVARDDRPSRGGLGLGLYLVKELVEAHGGTVAVASTVGAGTTFTVRLPLAAVAEAEAGGRLGPAGDADGEGA